MGLMEKAPILPRNESGIATVKSILKQQFSERFSEGQSIREQHGHTTTWLPNQPPDCVVFAHSTQEVSNIVRICSEHNVPIIPFGTGTSLEGHVNAPAGGISIDLSQMNAILEVNAEDLDCVVQAGVTRKQLNTYVRDTGLFFPIDPGADASLGGMAATRASGTNAVRYGTMKDNVLAATVVLPDGTIVKTGGRARKSSAGYDLTRLMVGSEGTLGIITELTLKLFGIPESIAAASCAFETTEGAVQATIIAIQSGIPMARIEFLDPMQVKACNLYSQLTLPEKPLLLLEFHGSENGVKEQIEMFKEISQDCGGLGFEWAIQPEERTRLWQARHDAYWASLRLRAGAEGISTDVCVPISRLADCIDETLVDINNLGFPAPICGHVGDGNFHALLLVDMNNPTEIKSAEDFIDRLNERAIRMDGTCTGEHGIGQGKRSYLETEHGNGVDVMRAIKSALDPQNVMNPGKVV